MKKRQWMLGLFGGVLASLASPGFAGDVTTPIEGIEIGGQVRARYDYRNPDTYGGVHAIGATDSAAAVAAVNRFHNEKDDTGSLRAGLTARLNVGGGVTGLVDVRSVHVNGATAVGTEDGNVTMHQAYMSIADLFGQSADLKVGRMELNYGDQRLIGVSDWSQASRHWDGAVLRWRHGESTWLDLGYAELVNGDVNVDNANFDGANLNGVGTNTRPAAGAARPANDSDQDHDFYWAWLQHNMNDGVELNAYWLFEDNPINIYASERGSGAPRVYGRAFTAGTDPYGTLERHTMGTLLKGEMGNAYATVEYAHQWGRIAHDQINADLFVGLLGFNVSDQANVEFEYVLATGDEDGLDGKRNGFSSPYPTGHSHLGITDQVGFRNVEAFRLGAGYDLNEKTSVDANWNWFRRDSRDDGLYNSANTQTRTAGGVDARGLPYSTATDAATVAANATGSFWPTRSTGSKDIGQEFNLVASHQYSKFLTLDGGWGHFIKGRFLKQGAASTRDMDYFYVQANLKF